MTCATEPTLALKWLIEAWEPDDRPVHCSNCLHAKVSGSPDKPEVGCDAGHSKQPVPLARLIRARNPTGFMAAEKCEDFESMSDA